MFFKKVPYGVKVRVKGNDETGYTAECALHCSRILPACWTTVVAYDKDHKAVCRFETLKEAKAVAMHEYDRWISFYMRKEAERKDAKMASKQVVWEHP